MMMETLQPYRGVVPPCGIYCGGCPVFIRKRNPCPGAEISQRCQLKACRFYICTTEQGIDHCYQCPEYPCQSFKRFAKTWVKYGQDLFENQASLQDIGIGGFLECWNAKVEKDDQK